MSNVQITLVHDGHCTTLQQLDHLDGESLVASHQRSPEPVQIPISQIECGTPDPDGVARCIEKLRAGWEPPSVDLIMKDNGRYVIWSGKHRCAAAQQLGAATISAYVWREV